MMLQLSSDQEFFRETTAKFLDEQAPPAQLRERRHDAAGFDEKYWRRGAELGGAAVLGGEGEGGRPRALAPTAGGGAAAEPMHPVDPPRRFGRVTFDEVRLPAAAVVGEVGGAADQVERQLQVALVLVNAEAVGAMQAAF